MLVATERAVCFAMNPSWFPLPPAERQKDRWRAYERNMATPDGYSPTEALRKLALDPHEIHQALAIREVCNKVYVAWPTHRRERTADKHGAGARRPTRRNYCRRRKLAKENAKRIRTVSPAVC
jgi:hypothetical protein